MRALVTGHRGFIGRHVREALTARGYLVVGVDTRDSWAQDCRDFFQQDRGPFDLVVHCAALVDGRETIEARAAFLGAYNLQLDGALFEWALRAKPGRVVYFSSSAAYPVRFQRGSYRGHALQERDAGVDPDASYGWVKLTGERIADDVRKAGVPVTVVRPFSGYGDDQDDCYPFPAMIARAVRRDDPFVVWGDGQQVRDFVHVDDVVGAILALVEREVDGPVNLGTGVGTSMDGLARLCMSAAGYDAPIKHLSDKPAGVQYRVADTSLMFRYYEPKVTLQEGVRRALASQAAVHGR